eukprot:jgi/Ulvmu1/3033/UM015_0073.1
MDDHGDADVPQRKALGTGRKKSRNLDNLDKSLACFTSALQGTPIIVELRNSAFVRGTLYVSDLFMNMFLSEVIVTREGGKPIEFKWMYIRARMVRMIHLPADLDFKAFLLQERTEVAASHAQRKVSLLSSTQVEAAPPSDRDAARPKGF